MKALALTTGVAAAFLASCANKSKVAETLVPVPYETGEASFGKRGGDIKGKWLSRGTSNVLEPEQVEAYPIARYQDPNNPNIMHERHFVYRKQAQKWNLTPNTSERVNLGNVPEVGGLIDGVEMEKISDQAVRNAIIAQHNLLKLQSEALQRTKGNEAAIKAINLNQKKLAEAMKVLNENQKAEMRLRVKAMQEAKARRANQQGEATRQSGDKDFYNK